MDLIYMDYNATTKLDEEVEAAIVEGLKQWGNPSSRYAIGQSAKAVIEKAREEVATLLEAKKHEIIFVSGGTEANNMAANSVLSSSLRPHIVCSSADHDSIVEFVTALKANGVADATILEPTETGSVSVESVAAAIKPETKLVTLTLANNETGAITDMAGVAAMITQRNEARENRIYLHVDATQAIGKVKVSTKEINADYMTITGHKFHGPRMGALFVREGRPVKPLVFGGGQEYGRRPGTENTPYIVGLGKAASLVHRNLQTYSSHMRNMVAYLRSLLLEIPGCLINFPKGNLLPNTLSISFPLHCGQDVLSKCEYLMASTGAACHSHNAGASNLLLKLLPREQAVGSIRLSVGRTTTKEEIERAVEDLKSAISKQETESS